MISEEEEDTHVSSKPQCVLGKTTQDTILSIYHKKYKSVKYRNFWGLQSTTTEGPVEATLSVWLTTESAVNSFPLVQPSSQTLQTGYIVLAEAQCL